MGVLFIHSTKRWSQHTRHCSSAGIISNKKHAPPLFSLTSSSNGRDRELLSAVTTWHDVLCFITQSCPTLCYSMDCSPPGSSVHGIYQARIRVGLPFPSPGDLLNPGIEPRSPALQADALTSAPPGSLQGLYNNNVSCMRTVSR